MTDLVVVEEIEFLTVEGSDDVVLEQVEVTEIITDGEQGPPGPAGDPSGALLIASAAHNLGAPRTINLPTLPLEFLHARNMHRLTLTAATPQPEGQGECRGHRLEFRETSLPTLIQRPQGGDMPSRVIAWVEPGTGRLCKGEVRTRDAGGGDASVEAVVRVEFEPDAAVGLTVPKRMEEEFFVPPLGRGTGEASYSNYRRFRTSGRVVPPR